MIAVRRWLSFCVLLWLMAEPEKALRKTEVATILLTLLCVQKPAELSAATAASTKRSNGTWGEQVLLGRQEEASGAASIPPIPWEQQEQQSSLFGAPFCIYRFAVCKCYVTVEQLICLTCFPPGWWLVLGSIWSLQHWLSGLNVVPTIGRECFPQLPLNWYFTLDIWFI